MAERSERFPDISCSDPVLQCCVCRRLLDKPQRLRCLHSCCLSCMHPSDESEEGDRQAAATTTATPTCPICQEVSSNVSYNGFLGNRVSRHIAIAKSSLCGMCADSRDGTQHAAAQCSSCRMSFCDTCLPNHGRFHKDRRALVTEEEKSWKEVCPTPSSLCSIHQNQFDFVCFSCKSCRCVDCWPSCSKLQHDIRHVNDAVVANYVEKAKGDIANLVQMLLSKAEVLSKRKHTAEDLDRALENDLKTLQDSKQQLLTVIDEVCVNAEKRLRDTYNGLRTTSEAMSRVAATTECKVSQAAGYSRYVLNEGSSSELFNEEQALVSRMTSLCSELDQLKQPLESGPYVAFDSTLPDQLKLVDLVTSWIGSPRVLTDDLCARIANPVTSSPIASVGTVDILRQKLEACVSAEIIIGVNGSSGCGKSSFINTLRRVRSSDPDAAPIGVVQETRVPTTYTHPQCPKVKLCDLPGVGTRSFPRGSYLQRIDFHRYDFFVIMCCSYFTELDIWLARTVQQSNKRLFFVRTKVDLDVQIDREDHPATHNETEVLRRTKAECVAELSKAGFIDPLVFLVCKNHLLFYFPALEEKLLAVPPELKRIGSVKP